MISRINGILIEKLPPTICIDVNGIGYDVEVPMSTFYDLPEVGAKVSLYTHLAIREDAHVLYGFLRTEERIAFRTLIKVSGIGARTALAILSGLSCEELAQAIAQQEATALTKVPGIGAKTAARLLLELKGKFSVASISPTGVATVPSAQDDILNALLALGYSEKESKQAMKTLPPGISVSEGIRLALQGM
ncbi:Holliday junction branch migration protein RuvA [Pelistega europaea]|uniref:Holliday junction branch migration complex subunit RuvA n=1 Tax=Pelistega europaea TaxID=106147 RepID=A0A7Y4LA08_9BURK|nr:Holliday junction branch migration protein RuvA [Pelistega europaea]NOL49750.1 Holliday junction branch migration protein RuvA [Pelistega europaea]